MRTKPCGRMCSKKRHKNSLSDRGSNFCLLWSAESRQRKVTWPSAKETRRWLQPGSEDLGLRKKLQVSLEVELFIVKSLFESVDELAAKNFTQHFLGKKVVV